MGGMESRRFFYLAAPRGDARPRTRGCESGRGVVARLDAECCTLVGAKAIRGDLDLAGCVRDGEAIGLDDERVLARVRFSTDER